MICLLILLILSLTEQKFLTLMKSSLSIIYFMDCVFGILSKKASKYPRSSRFSPTLSSKSFIVLHFTIRSVIHFELILMKGVRSVSRFIFFHIKVQLFQYHLLKTLSLLHCTAFAPLSKISWLYLCGCTSGLSILLHGSICLLFHQYHTILTTVAL